MGGRGSASSSSSGNLSNARAELRSAEDALDRASERLTESRFSPRNGRTERIDAAQREFNDARDKYDRARERVASLEAKQARNVSTPANSNPRPFVNSFGEATTRRITAPSYERSLRSTQRRIEALLGGKRR